MSKKSPGCKKHKWPNVQSSHSPKSGVEGRSKKKGVRGTNGNMKKISLLCRSSTRASTVHNIWNIWFEFGSVESSFHERKTYGA